MNENDIKRGDIKYMNDNLDDYKCEFNIDNLTNLVSHIISYFELEHNDELTHWYLKLNKEISIIEFEDNNFEIMFKATNNKNDIFKVSIIFRGVVPCYQVTILNITKNDLNMKYKISPFITTNAYDCIYEFLNYFINLIKYI